MPDIKISQLNSFTGSLSAVDYFPVNHSSSVDTFRATLLQLRNYISTGSISGSVNGNLTGSVTGSLTGTASFSNNSISASYALTSSFATTASFARNVSGSVNGSGTTNYYGMWKGTSLIQDGFHYYDSLLNYNVSSKNFQINKTTPIMLMTGSGQAVLYVKGDFNSSMFLQSAATSSDAWIFVAGADGGMPSSDSRGFFDLISYSSSNNFSSKTPISSSASYPIGLVYAMRIKSNGFYFWPLGHPLSLDGTFNVGVDSGTVNNTSRVMIDVYSGSSASAPQIFHLPSAITVRYGSGSAGSWPTTFCVSSSGNVVAAGQIKLGKNITHTSETYVGLATSGLVISGSDSRYKYIHLTANATASLVMDSGQCIDVIVNQGANPWNFQITFTGSYYSSSGDFYNANIIWPDNLPLKNYTGSAQTASHYQFICYDNGGQGPGSGYIHQKVIYARRVAEKIY